MSESCVDATLGINRQAWAVLALLSDMYPPDAPGGIEGGVHIGTTPWYNGRETGFVFSCHPWGGGSAGRDPLFIAVFEHRNSDALCAIKWTARGYMNGPRIEDVPEEAFPDKWTHAFTCGWGEAGKMAQWIEKRFEEHCLAAWGTK